MKGQKHIFITTFLKLAFSELLYTVVPQVMISETVPTLRENKSCTGPNNTMGNPRKKKVVASFNFDRSRNETKLSITRDWKVEACLCGGRLFVDAKEVLRMLRGFLRLP
jgi:hypothetical protein